MSLRSRALTGTLVVLLVGSISGVATADDADARNAFNEGAALVEKAQWAEALTAFERAASVRRHAITTYNIAACERAMGRYTRARRSFAQALAQNAAAGGKELPASLDSEARGALEQIDGILAKVSLSVDPVQAKVLVDGRPLEVGEGGALVAGLRAPGQGEALARAAWVTVDPGAHVFTFQREGFVDVVLNKTFFPAARATMDVKLELLPATLRISSNRPRALVAVNGLDVGPVPVDVLRPAGVYKVLVRDDGYVPYEGSLTVKPGQAAALKADLTPEKPSVFSRWWFWTATGLIVAGAATATYLLVRPEPRRAAVSGGSVGWTVAIP
jgi:hypothetical protein